MSVMKCFFVLVLVLSSIYTLASPGVSSELHSKENSKVVDRFVSTLASGNTNTIADQILYPSHFDWLELMKERHFIGKMYEVLHKHFGKHHNSLAIFNRVNLCEFTVSAGQKQWWFSNPSYKQKLYMFSVDFEHFGTGSIKITTATKDGIESIVEFSYAFPDDYEDTIQRVQDIEDDISLNLDKRNEFLSLDLDTAKTFILALQSRVPDKISELMFYPPSSTLEELKEYYIAVTTMYQVLNNNFGSFSNLRSMSDQTGYIEINTCAGPPSWWDSKPEYVQTQV